MLGQQAVVLHKGRDLRRPLGLVVHSTVDLHVSVENLQETFLTLQGERGGEDREVQGGGGGGGRQKKEEHRRNMMRESESVHSVFDLSLMCVSCLPSVPKCDQWESTLPSNVNVRMCLVVTTTVLLQRQAMKQTMSPHGQQTRTHRAKEDKLTRL